MSDLLRRAAWFSTARHEVDVVVVGAGAVGATIYRELAAAGYRVVVVDQGDVGSGASQGSANLIWGGLLYLARGRVDEVWRWSRERDRLVADPSAGVGRLPCSYRIDDARRHPRLVQTALLGYWLLGGAHGQWPRNADGHLEFAEARLLVHDARWTWNRLAATPEPNWVATWCAIEEIHRDGDGWELRLTDRLDGGTTRLHTRWVINASGAWSAQVDAIAGIDHGWEVVVSRGVSLVVAGRRDRALMVEHPDERDLLSLVPFPQADAAIWGSTETLVASPEAGMQPEVGEIARLLALHHRLIGPLERDQLLGLRCGVRALAVRRGTAPRRSQDLTRSFRILGRDDGWITILGGKLTGAAAVAREVLHRVARRLGARPSPVLPQRMEPPGMRFPGTSFIVPDPAWCRDHEQCWTLACWLRRRTPIAQVIPRGGLGLHDEYRPLLADIANRIMGDAGPAALVAYASTVEADEERIQRAFELAAKETP